MFSAFEASKICLFMLNIVVKYNFEEFDTNACFNSLPQIAYFTLTANDSIIQEFCGWSSNLHRKRQIFLFLIYLSSMSLIKRCSSRVESLLWIGGQSFGCHSEVDNDGKDF